VAEIVARQRMALACKSLFGVRVTAEELSAQAMEYLLRLSHCPCRLVPGIGDVMESAQSAQVPMGIVTSSGRDYARWIAGELGVARFISDWVCADSQLLEGSFKPSPKPWAVLWSKLGLNPDKAVIVFEDTLEAAIGACQSHRITFVFLLARSNEHEEAYCESLAKSTVGKSIRVVRSFAQTLKLFE